MKKVFIVGSYGSCSYAKMFLKEGWEIVDDVTEADLVQFTGGEDVTPALYGEKPHPTTGFNTSRDEREAGVFAICYRMGKPMAGICRGGQFLNVMSGGSMYQHVDGHAIRDTHECFDQYNGRVINVTSTHHQMMLPSEAADIIALADEASKLEFMAGGNVVAHDAVGKDVEVVSYEHTKCLCFQPHPEFHGADETREYYFELLNSFFGL